MISYRNMNREKQLTGGFKIRATWKKTKEEKTLIMDSNYFQKSPVYASDNHTSSSDELL